MGFMDFLGSAAGAVIGGIKGMAEKTERHKEEYKHMTDKQLFAEWDELRGDPRRAQNLTRMVAIRSILEERGYDVERLCKL